LPADKLRAANLAITRICANRKILPGPQVLVRRPLFLLFLSVFRSANIIYVAVYNLDEHSGFRGQEREDQSVLTLSRFAHSCHSDRPSALSSAGYGQRDLQVPSQARRHVRYARFIERHFQMTVTRTRCDIASLRPHNDIIPRQVRQRSDSLLSARCSGHAR